MTIDKQKFNEDLLSFLKQKYNVQAISKAVYPKYLHEAIGTIVQSYIRENWENTTFRQRRQKYAAYLSMEFLIGRMIHNNLFCLGLLNDIDKVLKELDIEKGISTLEDINDAALGNGGLGRLAACFLDSAATHNIPLIGHGIRYKYGLFKQQFTDGKQIESADEWQLSGGDPWGVRKNRQGLWIKFSDMEVFAVPYDYPVIGYDTFNIGTLRLWQAEADNEFSFEEFNNQHYLKASEEKVAAESISAVLYPNDGGKEGQKLRLRQQYFFSSAAIQDILRNYSKLSEDYTKLPEFVSVQLNDTHPVIAIPELILQLKNKGLSFEQAFHIAAKVFNYTNHTVMPEALEKWSIELMEELLPEIYDIIVLINEKMLCELYQKLVDKKQIERMKIIQNGLINMAYLASYVGKYINGVAAIHSDLLKKTVLKDFYAEYPKKFQNKTNGITQRRWLGLCNPELCQLFTKLLKNSSYLTDLTELKSLEKYADDKKTLKKFIEIKKLKKQQLASFIKEREDITINTDTIFDIQIKRLHEYKRQLLNAFSILWIYYGIKDGSITDFYPTTFLFGAKSAPGYRRAKGIINFINDIGKMIDNDPDVNKLIKVVFVQNYNVSYAEKLIPAADISEQISTAGTEASGTGNMKLMLNGSVTLGTLDGANIEIAEKAGIENNYIFGATVEEIFKIKKNYDPREIMANDEKVRKVVNTLIDGTFKDPSKGEGSYRELYYSLLDGASWHTPDQYYLLLDLPKYVEAKLKSNTDYKNSQDFAKKQWLNAVNAGKFSSDRTIKEYAEQIWELE
ncbi:MAG: glycogen/starch/alpha-glucan family phosphorylase [Oscillospiraceae bacterium]|jgi:starch phosphorylase|nr:glycogen/starch/alpha-glucan family phosphorylase [Oscillospiraceae bacterium]